MCRQGAVALKGSVCVVPVGHWRGILLSRKELDISGSVSGALSVGVWVQCQAGECISEAWGQRGGQVTCVCVPTLLPRHQPPASAAGRWLGRAHSLVLT